MKTWRVTDGKTHFEKRSEDHPAESAKRKNFTGFKPIEDPPKQKMKWPDAITGKVYDSFEEYWEGTHGHKFGEMKKKSDLALAALYYAALTAILAATAGLIA